MVHARILISAGLLAAASGCAGGPKPPPEPDAYVAADRIAEIAEVE